MLAQAALNNLKSRQKNPCDHMFWTSRGWPYRPVNWRDVLDESGYYDSASDDEDEYDQLDDRTRNSRERNPCDQLFWRSRGWPRRPGNWKDILERSGYYDDEDDDNEEDDDNDEDDDYDDDDDYGDDDSESTSDDYSVYNPLDDPEMSEFWTSRGWPRRPPNYLNVLEISGYYDYHSDDEDDDVASTSNMSSRESNPCDKYFWKSRGWPRRPNNWNAILRDSGFYNKPEVRQLNVSGHVNATSTPQTSRVQPQQAQHRHHQSGVATSRSRDESEDNAAGNSNLRNPPWKGIPAVEYTNKFPENNLCSSCVIYVKNYFLRCGHLVCAKCAEHLYNSYNSCPFCRKKIEEEPIQIFINV